MKTFDINPKEGTFTITYNDGRYPYTYKIEAIQKNIKKEEPQPHNYNPGYEEFIFDTYEQYQKWKISKGIDEQLIEIFDDSTQRWMKLINYASVKMPKVKGITGTYNFLANIYGFTELLIGCYNGKYSIGYTISKAIYMAGTSRVVGFVFDFILNEGPKGLAKLAGIPLEENWDFFNELYKGILAAAGANPSIHPKGKVKIRIETPVINTENINFEKNMI